MTDLSAFIHLVPEPWRTYALAGLFAFLASQMVASLIVALLPAAAFAHPVLGRYARALATFGHFKPSDAPGTLKVPLSALDARSLDELARVAAQGQRIVGAITPSKVPPPIPPQGGYARLGAVALILATALCIAGLGAVLSGCPNWNRPECPTPGVYSCAGDQPHYCAPTKELTPIGDEPCGLQGRVCALNDAGVARCAPAPDSGDAADGGAR